MRHVGDYRRKKMTSSARGRAGKGRPQAHATKAGSVLASKAASLYDVSRETEQRGDPDARSSGRLVRGALERRRRRRRRRRRGGAGGGAGGSGAGAHGGAVDGDGQRGRGDGHDDGEGGGDFGGGDDDGDRRGDGGRAGLRRRWRSLRLLLGGWRCRRLCRRLRWWRLRRRRRRRGARRGLRDAFWMVEG